MLTLFSSASLEAQKLISVSIGKINASRVTRTGTSLHKSLLVASVLHKARYVYLEEERERVSRFPPCPQPPELTVTPVCPVNDSSDNNSTSSSADDKENRLTCLEDSVATAERVGEESRLPLGEANTGNNVTHTTNTTTTVTSITSTTTITTTSSSSTSSPSSRKRRRVSDQETAAAISSILPKRLRSELKEDNLKSEYRCALLSQESATEILEPAEHCNNNDQLFSDSSSGKTFTELKTISTETITHEVCSRLSSPDKLTCAVPSVVTEDPAAAVTCAGERDYCYSSSVPVAAVADPTPSCPSTPKDTEPCPAAASAEEDGKKAAMAEDPSSSPPTEDSDSDGDDSASDTSTSSCEEEMEVEQLSSLVSYFSLQSQKQADFCLVPLHHGQSGPHIVALTA